MSRSTKVLFPTARSRVPAAAPTRRAGAGGLHALQRSIGNHAVGRLLGELSAGAPPDRLRSLPPALRARMEAAFGADFTGVRVFEGEQSLRFGARAYTDGHEVHLAPGRSEPATRRGQELLGHELAHVVQQSQGRVPARTR